MQMRGNNISAVIFVSDEPWCFDAAMRFKILSYNVIGGEWIRKFM